MIFEFESDGDSSTLRAHFELGEKYTGKRQEGAFREITYSGTDITFDYGVNSIHPDLLGLPCLVIFYPFVGQRVVFPMPVSRRLEKAFRKTNFTRPFRFDNVDPALDRYSGSKMALSFGGGIDSTAVRVMFPEAFVVHEAHTRNGRLVPSFSYDVVRSLGPERAALVTSNQRYVSQPGGWHGWTCAFATSLLLATDYDFGIVLMGSTISSTLLYGGARYWNRFAARRRHGVTENYWQSAFNEVRATGVLTGVRRERIRGHEAVTRPDPAGQGLLLHRQGRRGLPPVHQVPEAGPHEGGCRPAAPAGLGPV